MSVVCSNGSAFCINVLCHTRRRSSSCAAAATFSLFPASPAVKGGEKFNDVEMWQCPKLIATVRQSFALQTKWQEGGTFLDKRLKTKKLKSSEQLVNSSPNGFPKRVVNVALSK